MYHTTEILDLIQYKMDNEAFIVGTQGTLRLPLYKETLYNYLPNALYFDNSFSTLINCTFAVTDKRIIIVANDLLDGSNLHKHYSFKFTDLKIKYKKSFGNRLFILYLKDRSLFNFTDRHIIFEFDNEYSNQADRINMILNEYNIQEAV